MDVKRAAELAELPLDEFLALNPQHNRPVISGADDYAILLPIDKAEIFAAKLDLVDQPLVSWQAHRMKAGETLPQVALRYGMSIETLRSVNGIGPRADGAHRLCAAGADAAADGGGRGVAGERGVHHGAGGPHVLPYSRVAATRCTASPHATA